LYHQNRGIVRAAALSQEALFFEVIFDRQETSPGLWF
jgi:hypothetical protein